MKHTVLVVSTILLIANAADAKPKPQTSAPATQSVSHGTPGQGGACTAEHGVKTCWVDKAHTFDVYLSLDHILHVTLDEGRIEQITPPDPTSVAYDHQCRKAKDPTCEYRRVVYHRVAGTKTVTSTISTPTLTITLLIHPGDPATDDKQLQLIPTAAAKAEARCVERTTEAEQALQQREADLQAEVEERQEVLLLERIAEGRVSTYAPTCDRGCRARSEDQSFLVVEAQTVWRVDKRRYLKLLLKNRGTALIGGEAPLEIEHLEAWLVTKGVQTPAPLRRHCAAQRLEARAETTCTIAIDLDDAAAQRSRVKVRFRDASQRRSVTLDGIFVR